MRLRLLDVESLMKIASFKPKFWKWFGFLGRKGWSKAEELDS